MTGLNLEIFQLVNASANPPALLVAAARFSANWLIYVVIGGLVIGWVRGSSLAREQLIDALATALLALLVNFAIAASWYHPRPFELAVGHQLLPHAAETSFPSDHATVLFAIAFGLIQAGAARFWSGIALLAAVIVAWARIYVGIHWPLDMAGSLTIALIGAWVIGRFSRRDVWKSARRALVRFADLVVNALRIPTWLYPRS